MKNYWRQGILYLTALGMKGCWLYVIIDLLNKQVVDGRLSVIGLLFAYPLAFCFWAFLMRLRWPEIRVHSIYWLVWVMAVLLTVKIQLFGELAWTDTTWLLAVPRAIADIIHTFKPELLVIIVTGVLWWLGGRLVYLQNGFAAQVGEFQLGLVMLVITFLVSSQIGVDLGGPLPVMLVFFLFALLGMSLAHAMEGTSWLSSLNRGHWSVFLLLNIGLILIVGVLISALVTPHLLDILWSGITWVCGYIFWPINAVYDWITRLFHLKPAASLNSDEPPPPPSGGHSELVHTVLAIVWTLLIGSVVLIGLIRMWSDILRWLRRKLADMQEAEFEPLPGTFRVDLFGLLRCILYKLMSLRLPFPGGKKGSRQYHRKWTRCGKFIACSCNGRLNMDTHAKYLRPPSNTII